MWILKTKDKNGQTLTRGTDGKWYSFGNAANWKYYKNISSITGAANRMRLKTWAGFKVYPNEQVDALGRIVSIDNPTKDKFRGSIHDNGTLSFCFDNEGADRI